MDITIDLLAVMLSGPWKGFLFFPKLPLPTIKGVAGTPPKPKSTKKEQQITTLAMARLAPSFVFLILILLSEMSMGQVEIIGDGMKILEPLIKMHRKVLMEFTMDYDYGGANCKHDPRKGKCGKIP